MRQEAILLSMLLATATSAAPPLTGTIDPRQPPKVPSGPIVRQDVTLLLDTQASFDFTNVPIGDYKPTASNDGAQQLLVPKPSYAMIVPILGAAQRHALRVFGITTLTPAPIDFLSRPFEVSKRKTLTVDWDGQFTANDNTVELHVGLSGWADLAAVAIRNGQIFLITKQGYTPFTTDAGAKTGGASVSPSEHRFVVSCGALSHACTVSFSQQGHTFVSPSFTLPEPTLMPTPQGLRRVYLRMAWPSNEASSVHIYDVRRLAISGGLPG